MESTFSSPLQSINEIKLCNLLPYGNYCIIDTRSFALFDESAILGSVHCPPPNNFDTENENHEFTLTWLTENCISSVYSEKFAWLPLLKTVIAGENIADPWIICLYKIFLAAKFKYVPEFLNIKAMKDRYPLLFTPRGESITFKKFRYPSEIIPNFLWLGSVESAQDRKLIESLNITHIVNATIRSRRNFFPEIVKYLTVDVLDEVSEDMSEFFIPVNAFINEAELENGRVLVHCQAGISRSASLVINYLRVRNRWSLKDSLEYVTQQRPEVHPNRSFMEQLIRQEALSDPDHVTSIQLEDIGLHGGVREKFIRRMTSSNSSLSIENTEAKSVGSLKEPLVSITESEIKGQRQEGKSKCICCILC